MKISVVIPVYNSADLLPALYSRLKKVLGDLVKEWEIILVNDFSLDDSWKGILSLTKKDKRIIGVNLMNNYGQHNAVMCGFSYASGDYVVQMDDDLQHPPEEIKSLHHTIKKSNYLVVYGQYIQKNHGWFRDICSKMINNTLSKITNTGYNVTSFKIIDKSIINKLRRYNNYNVMIDVFIKDIVGSGLIGHCQVRHDPRSTGKSNYTFRKLLTFASNMIFNYTIWPLRISTFIGFLISFLSFILAAVELYIYFFNGIDIRGWTMMFVVIAFMFGIVLFILGIVGEYIGKSYLLLSHKPQYTIKDVINYER